jgi:uncharacterized protein YqeY
MGIQEQLQQDLKQAMKARDSLRVDVIRGARDAIQKARLEAVKQQYDAMGEQQEASTRIEVELDEATLTNVLSREVKRRKESADMYRNAGHTDRAEREEAEARILQAYLPAQLGAEDLRPQIAALITEMGLSGPAAMGKLMPVLMERFKGQADGKLLSQLARELLQGE